MASIIPKTKDGKIISYKFKACVGRDDCGKQVFRCMTWKVPGGLGPVKAEKAAEKAAAAWEQEAKAEYEKDLQDAERARQREIARCKTDFVYFVKNVWFPICMVTWNFKNEAYSDSHESDPPENKEGFKELDELLGMLPLDNNDAVFNLCCSMCSTYEHKAFIVGLQYGAYLMFELK